MALTAIFSPLPYSASKVFADLKMFGTSPSQSHFVHTYTHTHTHTHAQVMFNRDKDDDVYDYHKNLTRSDIRGGYGWLGYR